MHSYTVLVAADDSLSGPDVVRAAALAAKGRAAYALHVLHAQPPLVTKGVYDDEAIRTIESEHLERVTERLRGLLDVANRELGAESATGHLVTGDPTTAILGVAKKLRADLIVVGTHDYRGLTRFLLGSVSEVIAKNAHCPVMLVRPAKYDEGAATEPMIEPLCEECAKARKAKNDVTAWCERHSTHHARALLHYEYPGSYGVGSMTFRP